ncbi:glycoside hydrolase family 15 protein [Cohnella caldifontis]|uniref:glycoside hydrolase family 15 protein n=1 Tax=Cohnella caldifontis TaxID=3027471 RepID=UPI0023ED1C4A|nr:glycoside hydrolase family 15 protein [Cohnella sp. YIM B05605]
MKPDLVNKPYLVDAVIGNSRFLASVLDTGRIVRFWWPHVDYPQHADRIRSGLRLAGGDGRATWFDGAEDGWRHESSYVPGTNIFAARAESPRVPIRAEWELYAVPGEDALVFDYRFTNTGTEPASFQFVFYSSIKAAEMSTYQTTEFRPADDALVHFHRDYFFSVSSANVCTAYQSGYAWEQANAGGLNGSDINMAPDGAMEWAFEDVAPGGAARLTVYLAAGRSLEDSLAALRKAKSAGPDTLRERTAGYWKAFVDSAAPCPSDRADLRELYERSLLAIKLMADELTGSIIAAPEFDEFYTRCGGYGYCWGRDAAFITTALDKAGLHGLSTRFYEWTLTAQDEDGAWQQRHYHDGRLAPSWGLQIDEGASILWGMLQHYRALPDAGGKERFLRAAWPAVRKGADYLTREIDASNGLPNASRDLWEERFGQHTYSSAAVYAGLKAATEMAALAGEPSLGEGWNRAADRIGETVRTLCWNEENGVYYRGLQLAVDRDSYERARAEGKEASETRDAKGYPRFRLAFDPVVDVSLLGVSVPFGVVPPDHPQAWRTADAVERALTVPGVGGIKRYEDDPYIGGNPWILTTLWLAQFRALAGQPEEAEKLVDWAANHRTKTGLLPEQVDKASGGTAWVVPLTWSHAMFILAVHLTAEARSAPTGRPRAANA